MGLSTIGRGMAAVAIAGALAFSCSTNDSSKGGAAGGTGGGDAGDAPWSSTTCGVCVANACGNERTNCLSEPTCAAYVSCLEACPAAASGDVEPACVAACPAPADTAAQKAKDAFETCRSVGPGAACAGCGGPDGGSPNPFEAQVCAPSTAPDACHQCYDEHCCEADEGCNGSPDCLAYLDCIDPCGADPACLGKCSTDFPQGAKSFMWSYTCDTVYCPNCPSPDPCSECEVTKCQSTFIACRTDVACFLHMVCLYGCKVGDEACVSQCEAKAPASAVAEASAFTLCREYYCGTQC